MATTPVNLTPTATLNAAANAWIDAHGLPNITAVETAIRRADLAGDPNRDNPFREALLRAAARRGARRYIVR